MQLTTVVNKNIGHQAAAAVRALLGEHSGDAIWQIAGAHPDNAHRFPRNRGAPQLTHIAAWLVFIQRGGASLGDIKADGQQLVRTVAGQVAQPVVGKVGGQQDADFAVRVKVAQGQRAGLAVLQSPGDGNALLPGLLEQRVFHRLHRQPVPADTVRQHIGVLLLLKNIGREGACHG